MEQYPFSHWQCKVVWSHASLKTSLKTTLSSVKQLAAGVQEIYAVKIFQIPRGTKRWSLSLVKLKTFPAFFKMNSTSDFYSEFSKIFRATISRGCFCLSVSQEITVYWCEWFYFLNIYIYMYIYIYICIYIYIYIYIMYLKSLMCSNLKVKTLTDP